MGKQEAVYRAGIAITLHFGSEVWLITHIRDVTPQLSHGMFTIYILKITWTDKITNSMRFMLF